MTARLAKKGEWYSLVFYALSKTPERKRVTLKTRTKREAERLRRLLEDASILKHKRRRDRGGPAVTRQHEAVG